MDKKEIFINIPAYYLWDDKNKHWIVQKENGWKAIDKLNSKYLIDLSVRRATIGLLPDDETVVEVEYVKAEAEFKNDHFDFKSYVVKNGNNVLKYMISTKDNEDKKYSEFVIGLSTNGEKIVYYGNARWGEYVPELETPNFIQVKNELDHRIDIADNIPVLIGDVELYPPSIPNYNRLSLKPGIIDDEITLEADIIRLSGLFPPSWPVSEDKITIKLFVGPFTPLLDTPLRPDFRSNG